MLYFTMEIDMTLIRSGMFWRGTMVICSFLTAIAYAQQSSVPTDASEGSQKAKKTEQLESIVVTATKRKEDVTKVPLSITVIGGEALEDQHITSIADLTRSVPNLSFSGGAQGGGSGLSNIELRGSVPDSPRNPRNYASTRTKLSR